MAPHEKAEIAVKSWIEWCDRPTKSGLVKVEHIKGVATHIVDAVLHAYASALVPDSNGWFPIDSLPEGEHVQLYWPHGEKGVGGIECATVFRQWGEPWHYWTHGGPNSGLDFDPRDDEKPTHWRPLPAPPKEG
jgi:hypothetical protein